MIKGGAPNASCSARAPIILVFSNRVNVAIRVVFWESYIKHCLGVGGKGNGVAVCPFCFSLKDVQGQLIVPLGGNGLGVLG